MRWAALLLGGLVACGGGDGGAGGAGAGTTSSSGACEPGATYLCNCADQRPGWHTCRADGQGFEACDCGPTGSGSAGQGGGQGGGGGAGAPECATAGDCETKRLECGATCTASCSVGGVCVVLGPFECSVEMPCPAAPVCMRADCVVDFQEYSSACVISNVPDGTPCTPGGMALCQGGVCDP